MKRSQKTVFKIVVLVLMTSLFLEGCSLKPLAWTPPKKPKLIAVIAENDLLESSEHIDLEGWYGPEDIAVDQEGNLYCGVHKTRTNFKDGRILKIDTSGEITTFCNTGAWVTGLHFDQEQNLIACDQKRGLISINLQGQIKVLTNQDEGADPFLIPNDVDIATDGIIYFSNTSAKHKFSRKNARRILMEMRADGGLYCYNPQTKEVQTLIDSSFFGNGVALSKEDSFVLMVELAKYRVLRHWLKGTQKGLTEIFIDNLPGLPNGISRRADGSFWLGFTTKRDDLLDKIQPRVGLKKILFAFPLWLQPKQKAYGMIMHLSPEGEILKTYHDTTGKIISEASSVEEHNGYLYLGGDLTAYIGKYKLEE